MSTRERSKAALLLGLRGRLDRLARVRLAAVATSPWEHSTAPASSSRETAVVSLVCEARLS